MKRILLLPLLLGLTSPVNAESYSLVIGRFTTNNVAVTDIPNIKFSSLLNVKKKEKDLQTLQEKVDGHIIALKENK